MICLNCGNRFKGNFCPHCGQSAKTRRLKLREMMTNAVAPFMGGDSRFVRSCRDLLVRPGIIARNYLIGRRMRYYHPLQMYVYLLTAYAVFSYVLGVSGSFFDDMTTIRFDAEVEPSKYSSVDYVLGQITNISSNKLYGTIALALISVVPYRWVFRKCDVMRQDGKAIALNHIEQFYTQLYHSCVTLALSILMLPLCFIPGADDVLSDAFPYISFVYSIILYSQLMGIKLWKSAVLNTIAWGLTVLLAMLIMFLVVVPFGVMEGLKEAPTP